MTFFHDPYVRPGDQIEKDPMFAAWSRNLPRLWYLDQRQATRLDAESLYGQARFAVFISRTHYEALLAPVDTTVTQNRKYIRGGIDAIDVPADSNTRKLILTRTYTETLAEPEDIDVFLRPSDSPTTPPAHLIIADGRDEIGMDMDRQVGEGGLFEIHTEDNYPMKVEYP